MRTPLIFLLLILLAFVENQTSEKKVKGTVECPQGYVSVGRECVPIGNIKCPSGEKRIGN